MNYNTFTYKNIRLNHVQTKPFKSTKIRLSFLAPLEEKKATVRAILPYIMKSGTKNYKDRSSVSRKTDDLYSAKFNVGVTKKGLAHIIIFELSIIDDDYTLNQESLFEEGLAFLHEMIYNPLLKEQTYKEEYRLMMEYYQSIYANKMRYTIQQLQDQMFVDEPYKIPASGNEETLKQIRYEDVLREYESLITKDQLHITVVGNISLEECKSSVEKLFVGHNHVETYPLIESIDVLRDTQTITIKHDVEQAKLVLGYRLPIYYKEDYYYQAVLFDMLFGGSSESLLFSRLREELGLVYSVQSSYNPYKGVFFIYLGINKEEYETVLQEINTLIEEVKTSSYDNDVLEIAKKQYINSLIQSYDSIGGLAYKIEHASMHNNELDKDKTIQTINSIKKDELMEVTKRLSLDTICFLAGDDHE